MDSSILKTDSFSVVTFKETVCVREVNMSVQAEDLDALLAKIQKTTGELTAQAQNPEFIEQMQKQMKQSEGNPEDSLMPSVDNLVKLLAELGPNFGNLNVPRPGPTYSEILLFVAVLALIVFIFGKTTFISIRFSQTFYP